jgi:hypothetical protein
MSDRAIIYERAVAMPPAVRLLCEGGSWVVGSAAAWLVGATDASPKDWDVLVPFSEWRHSSRIVPPGAEANSFGGFKFASGDGVVLDVWPGELAQYFALHPSGNGFAVYPPTWTIIKANRGYRKEASAHE